MIKNYANYHFFLLLISLGASSSASVSPSIQYLSAESKKAYLLPKQPKQKLFWGEDNSQAHITPYCLTPSDPGCSNMWQKEREKDNDERKENYEKKRLNSSTQK